MTDASSFIVIFLLKEQKEGIDIIHPSLVLYEEREPTASCGVCTANRSRTSSGSAPIRRHQLLQDRLVWRRVWRVIVQLTLPVRNTVIALIPMSMSLRTVGTITAIVALLLVTVLVVTAGTTIAASATPLILPVEAAAARRTVAGSIVVERCRRGGSW